jgi:ATP-dependent DNA helicase DinG
MAGDVLSLVVIDKLPNNHATDPVHTARRQQMQDKYGNGYGRYDIPQVITRLKQGVGRLIRTDTDSGVMAILDNRMGSNIRKAMPPAIQTSKLQDVEQFFIQH